MKTAVRYVKVAFKDGRPFLTTMNIPPGHGLEGGPWADLFLQTFVHSLEHHQTCMLVYSAY